MDLLVTYDVDTTTSAGRGRLRRVARVCEGYGQRVQYSVFEMVVTETQYTQLAAALNMIITGDDSIRMYKLHGAALDHVECLGRRATPHHRDPWIL